MKMNAVLVRAAALAAVSLLMQPAHAKTPVQTLTFDDIMLAPDQSQALAAGYAGFNWSANFDVLNTSGPVYSHTGFGVGTMSGDNVAFAAGGMPVSMTSTHGLMTFFGAYMTAASDAVETVEVQGYRGATLLYDKVVTINDHAPQLFQFNVTGADRLSFKPGGGAVVFDNIQVGAVPEPETVALLGMGVCGLLLRRRSRRHLFGGV